MHSRSKKFWQRKIAKEKSRSPWNGSRRMRHGSSGVVRVSSLPSYGRGKCAEKAVWRCGKGSTATPKCPSRDAKEAFLRCGRGSFASRQYVFRLTKKRKRLTDNVLRKPLKTRVFATGCILVRENRSILKLRWIFIHTTVCHHAYLYNYSVTKQLTYRDTTQKAWNTVIMARKINRIIL